MTKKTIFINALLGAAASVIAFWMIKKSKNKNRLKETKRLSMVPARDREDVEEKSSSVQILPGMGYDVL